MVTDLDIYRAANLLIRQHGGEAEIEASRKADLMLDRGDIEGLSVWRVSAPSFGIRQLVPRRAEDRRLGLSTASTWCR
jgi:hypothetical protein